MSTDVGYCIIRATQLAVWIVHTMLLAIIRGEVNHIGNYTILSMVVSMVMPYTWYPY